MCVTLLVQLLDCDEPLHHLRYWWGHGVPLLHHVIELRHLSGWNTNRDERTMDGWKGCVRALSTYNSSTKSLDENLHIKNSRNWHLNWNIVTSLHLESSVNSELSHPTHFKAASSKWILSTLENTQSYTMTSCVNNQPPLLSRTDDWYGLPSPGHCGVQHFQAKMMGLLFYRTAFFFLQVLKQNLTVHFPHK